MIVGLAPFAGSSRIVPERYVTVDVTAPPIEPELVVEIRGEIDGVVEVADRDEPHAETLATRAATLTIRVTSTRPLVGRRCAITVYRQGMDHA